MLTTTAALPVIRDEPTAEARLRALGIVGAAALAAGLATPEAVACLLVWLGVDPARAAELWAALAPLRAAAPKAMGHQAQGWVAPTVSSRSPPWLPGPGLWGLSLPPQASVVGPGRRVRDQNVRGTCVAFATCTAWEILRGDGMALSPQYLYFHMKQASRDTNTGSDGSHARISLDVLEDVGVCAEGLHPYVERSYVDAGEPVCGPKPSAVAAADARGRRSARNIVVQRGEVAALEADAPPRAVEEWLATLVALSPPPAVQRQLLLLQFARAALSGALGPRPRPVVGCFQWFATARDMAGESGVMPLPLPGDPRIGGHAMAVLGYADDSSYPGGGYLLVQNSWGEGWPRRSLDGPGLFRMCYAYAVAYLAEVGVPMLPGEAAALRIPVEERAASEAAGPRFCTNCGAPWIAGGRFCTGCGQPATGGGLASVAPPAAPQEVTRLSLEERARAAQAALEGRAQAARAALDARMAALGERGLAAASDPHGATRCVYCGSTSFGACAHGPGRRHKHRTDGRHCAWCGSTSYGGCSHAPHGRHEHGPGQGCVYCGSSSFGGCAHSPSRRHEHG
jgi:hypothetical protein